MILENMKKILSGIIIANLVIFYTAPMGVCISTSASNLDAVKPALRKPSQSASLKLEGDISISKGNPKISLSLRDSDVKQVLRMFADKAGLNIIFHNSVSGNVTLDLVNVPLNDAFKMVLQVADLTYYIDDNTMVVASATAAQTLNLAKQELMIIPVKYVPASVLAGFLNKNIFSINKPGLSNSQIAITNPSANEILIFGTKNDYIMAKKIIEQFDKKPLDETFVVNHTTPKEMAELICNVLLKSSEVEAEGTETVNTEGENEDNSGVEDIVLGDGITACRIDSSVEAGTLASLNLSSLDVTYFPTRGVINVTGGSQQQLELIKEFIQKNDKKQLQAYLEISIIELNASGTRQFDNTWNVYSSFFSGTFNTDGLSTNSNYPTFLKGDSYRLVDPNDPSVVLSSISKFTGTPIITYAINYILQNGKGRVLANPKIMITNGQKSVIDLSSDYVKSVTSQIVETSLQPITQKTYEIASDEGIKVEMIPFISPEGYVTLNIKPDYSTVKEKVMAENEITHEDDLVATLLQRRNLDLKNIRIRDGETLVIGGMIREEELKTVSKIPVLGDLPGIGALFRSSTSTKQKQELVIMITPKIIKDSDEIINQPSMTL